jgi:hypothetical protein
MKNLLLKKIRLSQYFIILFVLFVVVATLIPHMTFESGALTLFSVNSFLYGFYISPILSGQKTRVEELHKIVRAEANAIFAMVLSVAKLPKKLRNDIQEMFLKYIHAILSQHKAAGGELEYEAMISFCLDYKGDHRDDVDALLNKLVANQQNRTNFSMQMSNRVYSNEWIVMFILFSITLSFILLLNAGDNHIFTILTALLCTGLSMLLVILVKMSTLTHKKAKQIWDPYKKLIDSRFYRID